VLVNLINKRIKAPDLEALKTIRNVTARMVGTVKAS
jgi:hypothetical protein